MRSICLALVDSDILEEEKVSIDARGKEVDAVVVARHLRSDTPAYARPIVR